MLRPSHRRRSFTANRVFTDREDARAVFDAALRATETEDLYKVLMWYGVGGQGKSALLREFGRMVDGANEAEARAKTGRRLIQAKVDFDDERLKRVDNALYSIRLQLGQSSGLSFHTFDAAFVSYYRKTRPGLDVAAEFPELFSGEKEGLADLIDVLDDHLPLVVDAASVALPGANLIYKWGARLTGRLRSWWNRRGNAFLPGIERMPPEELLQKLPSFLGVDICDAIAGRAELRPVVMLDTYEALWRERGQKDALADRRTDAWVRLLVQDAPGVLFVVAGRDRLRWGEIDAAWDGVIDAHLLGGLSAEDADRFLRAVPIGEADIRARIVATSEGLPFYLDLQVSQYETMRERDETPAAAQFGDTPSDILSRFLEHLADADQAALRLASYVNTVTRAAMNGLAEAFPSRVVNFSFDRMVARSAFTRISDDAYTIHALMQEELQRREREENEPAFERIHRHLFALHDSWLLALPEEQMADAGVLEDARGRFEAAFSHLLAIAPDEAVDWLLEHQGFLAFQEAWPLIERMHRKAIAIIEATRPPEDPRFLVALNNLATALVQQERPDEGKSFLQRILAATEQGSHDQQLIGIARYNLGHILRDEQDFGAALEQFSRAIDVLQRLPRARDGDLFMANAALAECLYLQERHAEAEERFRIAARHAHAGGSREDLSLALHLLAEAHQALGRYEVAIPLFRESLRTVSDPHPAARPSDPAEGEKGRERRRQHFMPSSIRRSRLTVRYVDRRYIRAFERLFPERRQTSSRSAADGERDSLDGDLVAALLRGSDAAFVADAAIRPANRSVSTRFLDDVYDIAAASPTGAILAKVARFTGVRVMVYRWDSLDFGFDRIGKTLWLTVPHESRSARPVDVLAFVYWSRTVDHELMGFVGDSREQLVSLATFLHARALDCCVHVARFISEHDAAEQSRFLDLLPAPARTLVALVRDDRTREEMFDAYAEMLSTR